MEVMGPPGPRHGSDCPYNGSKTEAEQWVSGSRESYYYEKVWVPERIDPLRPFRNARREWLICRNRQ
jgi:hypothetical protein